MVNKEIKPSKRSGFNHMAKTITDMQTVGGSYADICLPIGLINVLKMIS